MARRPASVATSVVRQARAAAKVTDLETERLARAGVVRGIDPRSGRSFLKAVVPRAHVPPHEVDLSFLLNLPGLVDPLAHGFRLWGGSKRETSRKTRENLLRTGLVTFLMS